MSVSSTIIKNTGFLYLKMGITVFLSLYTTRIVLNALGSSDFGVFSVVGGAIAMLGFLNSSMSAATQRFLSYSNGAGDNEKLKLLFNNALTLHFGIAILVCILLVCLKPLFFDYVLNIESSRISDAEFIYYFMMLSTFFTIISVPYNAVINAHENMLYYSVIGIFESILKLLIAFFIVVISAEKLLWYGFLTVLLTVFVLLIMWFYCHRKYEECKINLIEYYDRNTIKQLASFAIWNLMGNSASVISGYGSGLILNHYFGTTLNATKGVLNQLNGQMLAFSNNLLKAASPAIVKAEGANNRQKMFTIAFSSSKLSFMMFAFFAIPFLAECDYLLKLWLVTIPPYLVAFCTIGFIQTLVEQLSIPLNTAIMAVGKIKWINIIRATLLYLSIIVLILCYSHGAPPYFVQQLMVVVASLSLLIRVLYCKLYLGMSIINYFNEVFLRCVVSATVSFFIALFVKSLFEENAIRLFAVIIATSVSIAVLFYNYVLTGLEREKVVELIMKLRSLLR